MEIEFFGANTLRLTTKKARFVVDDTIAKQGKKAVTKADDVTIQTDSAISPTERGRVSLDAPGEFEVGDVSIKAVAVRGHRDEDKQKTATVFHFATSDGTVVVAGHINPDLTDDQVEQIGHTDVLIVPIGGNGFTLDAEGALKVIKKLSPSVVIPTYYEISGIKTDMPQTKLSDALTQLAMTPEEPQASLKLKGTDFSSDQTKLVILEAKS